MAGNLPEPPVPPECAMGGNEWFKFYFDRLRKSRWWRRASDTARARNVMLWGEAYKATPAGSLPDDDDELAEAAGYGMNVDGFLAVKAEIMAPWTLCADGRWYHPTLCEVVLEAWERKSETRKKEAEKKRTQRLRTRGVPLESANVPRDTANVPRDNPNVPGDNADVPRDNPEKGRDTDTEERRGEKRNIVASASRSAPGTGEPWKSDAEFMAVWEGATPAMRRRAKSMRVAWGEWGKVSRTTDPAEILAGLRGYLREDPDVGRTGGPGLHLWLRNRGFEQYVSRGDACAAWTGEQWAAAVAMWRETGRWGDSLGPEPGKPGCKAPLAALERHGVGVAQRPPAPPAPPRAPVW